MAYEGEGSGGRKMSAPTGPNNLSYAFLTTLLSALLALFHLHVAMLTAFLKNPVPVMSRLPLELWSLSRTCKIKFMPLSVMCEDLDRCLQPTLPGISAAIPLSFLPQQSG